MYERTSRETLDALLAASQELLDDGSSVAVRARLGERLDAATQRRVDREIRIAEICEAAARRWQRDLAQIAAVRSALEEWAALQGHDLCHWHPRVLETIAAALGIERASAVLPPRAEFEEGCRRYQDELYGPRSRVTR